MTPDRNPAVAPQLAGYAFQRLLGSGGFADVYLYERELPRMPVAVKVLMTKHFDEQDRERFTQEANMMARFYSHPYIVGILSAAVAEDGRPYIVMQYYPRDNLWVRARRAPLAVIEALQIGVKIASAVETAHRAGVLHRDIKPANILTSEFGDPGLADFGISVTKDRRSEDEGALSIPWSPPEAFDADAAPDERSDVYSLAATVYTLLCGRSPFEIRGGSNNAAALMSRIERDPVRPTGRSDVPDSLERILRQAMAKRADLRHPTALAFARDLQTVEQELHLKMTPIVVPEDTIAAEDNQPRTEDSGETRGRMPRRIDPHRSAPASELSAAPGTVRRVQNVGPPLVSPAPPDRAAPPVEKTTLRSGAPSVQPPEPGNMADDRLEGTRRRSRSVGGPGPDETDSEDAATPTPVSRQDRHRARWLAAAAVMVVAVVAVVAALVSSAPPRRTSSRVGNAPTSSTTSPGTVFTAPVPAPSGVVINRTGAKAVVKWSNPDPKPGDFFVVLPTVNGVQGSPIQSSTTTANVTGAGTICVQVELVRQAGQTSAPTAPVCAP